MMTVKHPIKIKNGWLSGVRKIISPHFDSRPSQADISLLVIHYISLPPEQFGGGYIEDFFQGKLNPETHPYFQTIYQIRVSAHCLIERDGRVTQFVSFNDRAWHAGESCFQGREKCNDYAIGIELEGSNEQPFTEVQYQRLAELTNIIRHYYPKITEDRIVGHCDVAPGRKIDPGQYFEWTKYFDLLKESQ